jgi:hypothetical protein
MNPSTVTVASMSNMNAVMDGPRGVVGNSPTAKGRSVQRQRLSRVNCIGAKRPNSSKTIEKTSPPRSHASRPNATNPAHVSRE